MQGQTEANAAASAATSPLEARPLTNDDLGWALNRGWEDFKLRRGDLLLLPIIYVIVGIVASALAFNAALFPVIFPLAAGFALVGPIAAAGFYELARRHEAGLDSGWSHFLDPLKGRPRGPLLALSAMLLVLFLAWLASAQAIYGATLGRLGPVTPADFMRDLFSTSQGLTMIIVGNLVGGLFAVVTLAVSAFSFPLAVDKGTAAGAAVATSVAVFRRNPAVMLGWGLRVALILLLGALPLFVGLMLALPVLGYATWHLYTRAVHR
ncbi:hypothetical protein GCM10007973_18870 [Polymorphobacter multimanifer]|uniref:Putative membrane protein n=1 Tax=Polymorphobacter multimanifer TaxID=1070431 RepID=A0A841LAV9_9SPHN|nr:DUF2189 domain-containing protein [Polymorphobacter multimanifer]MBB6226955.1 putative membrane protein [Polymorphobacter multimanifer]GGI82652.1 hypothetical protein GCM10007973_18870 [Polymorphobacter multimanifer]